MRHLILTLTLLGACSSGNPLSDDMNADIDGLRAVVQAHYDDASLAADATALDALELTYDEDYDAAMMDMSSMMDMMMGCMDMHGADESSMDDMHDHMDELGTEHDDHGAAQMGCDDMATCMDAESAHYDAMMAHMDAMGADLEGWDEGMSCEGMDDSGTGVGGMGM